MRTLLLLLVCGCQSQRSWGDLDGRVVIDGAADASGVMVRAIGPTTAAAVTDGEGRYQLPGLAAGEYALGFTAADTLEEQQLVHIAVGAARQAVPEVRFTGVGTLEGTVTLAGRPGPGAILFVDGASAVATSDAAGRYRLEKVPAGIRSLEAVLSGYRPGQIPAVPVSRGQTTQAPPLDLAVDDAPPYPVAALAGTALRVDRDDHSGTVVSATRAGVTLTTTTSKDGKYHFDGLPTGLYTIELAYDGLTETIPQVLALAGSTGSVVDGALYPLEPNPIKLPVARRLSHDRQLLQVIDADRLLMSLPGPLDRYDQTLAVLKLPDNTLTELTDDANRGSSVVVAKSRTRLLYTAGVANYQGILRTVALDGSPPATLADLTEAYGYFFSKDETRVVYLSRYDLFSVAVAGGSPVRLGGAVQGSVVPHPDGQRVVFLSCDPTCHVQVSQLDGSASVSMLQGSSVLFVAPDGGHVLTTINYDSYLGVGQLWLATTDGTLERKVWDGSFYNWLVWSPDGRYAAFITDKTDLRVLDVTAMGDPAVVAQKSDSPSYPSDGTRLLYRADYQVNGNMFTLMQQPPGGGTPVQLGTRVDSFAPAPDGQRTLFLDGIDAASRLGALKVADAAGQVITLDSEVFPYAEFIGARVLYRKPDPMRLDQRQLWSVPVGGGTPVLLGDAGTAQVGSPGGSQVAWVDSEQTVRVAPATGGAVRVAGIGYPTWAGDSRLLIHAANTKPPYRHQDGLYLFEVTP